MLKNYLEYLKENEESQIDNKYSELKQEVEDLIKKTVENSGGEYNAFIDSYNKSPNNVQIEGLIDDSDIYDFYLKFRNDIDELLNDINYFDEVPSESNTFGLYDYIINGTKKSVTEIIKNL